MKTTHLLLLVGMVKHIAQLGETPSFEKSDPEILLSISLRKVEEASGIPFITQSVTLHKGKRHLAYSVVSHAMYDLLSCQMLAYRFKGVT